jgi:hypothetical protein
MEIEPGQIVFAKKYRTSNKKGAAELTAKGYWMTMLLGHAYEKDAPPSNEEIGQLLIGHVGVVTLDDVVEALGNEAFEKLKVFLQNKYSGKK